MAENQDQNYQSEQSQSLTDKATISAIPLDIFIEVVNPQMRDDTFNKYVVYTIRGTDKFGTFEIIRRYSDFTKLRDMIRAKWPGCYVPPLPPKGLNSLEAKVVKERRRYLTIFCQKIAALPYLHYYEGYQEFLRSKNPSFEKAIAPYLRVDYEEIIQRYAATFENLSGKEYNLAAVKKIIDFKTFLRKVQGQTETLKRISKNMVKAKINFYQEFNFLNGLVCMEYEKNVFHQLHDGGESKNLFHNEKSASLFQHAEQVNEGSKRPSFEYLEQWIKSEAREVEAFIESIDQKEIIEGLKNKAQSKQRAETDNLQNVLSGKQSFKAMILRKNKEEETAELEKQIAKYGKDFEDLSRLIDMITLVIAYEEIEKFKGNKITTYYNIVRTAAQNELATLFNMEQYWKSVLSNENLAEINTGKQ